MSPPFETIAELWDSYLYNKVWSIIPYYILILFKLWWTISMIQAAESRFFFVFDLFKVLFFYIILSQDPHRADFAECNDI